MIVGSMTTITGFHGVKPGDGPYFSPRFRVTQKSNAGKYFKKRSDDHLCEVDDYLTQIDGTSNSEFDVEDILSPRYAEFGFVRAYKARLRRRGLDPKRLYCVNRHIIIDSPRTCFTSLPKLPRRFLVQQEISKTKDDITKDQIHSLLTFNVKQLSNEDKNDIIKEEHLVNNESKTTQESKLDLRLRELDNNSTVQGFITRQRNCGRPLGNITSSSHLIELLEAVREETKRRSSIFYRTEIE